jgi:hypothetical protein
METSKLELIWASKPGCSRPVAEIWVATRHLWFVVFVDDDDSTLKFELLPNFGDTTTYLVDFTEAERLIDTAKCRLLAPIEPSV